MMRLTRRQFLGTTAAGTLAAPHLWVRSAAAQGKQLSVLCWSHFVPAYDKWFDQWGQEWAAKNNVKLTVASGKQEGDDQGQITAIEDSIARGDKGILITPMSTGVNAAIEKARKAGLFVIALDTPPDPASTVDITFATDNRAAGKLDGQWAAATLAGKDATIALLDLFDDKIVSVDYNRDQGFLEGMGIDTKDPNKNGDEDATGTYDGGDYEIVCNEPTNGAQPEGRTAMESCLTKNSNINVVYTINEPSAYGADEALKAHRGVDQFLDLRIGVIGGGERALVLESLVDGDPNGRGDHLGDAIDLSVGHFERAAYILNGGFCRHGVEGNDLRDLVVAVLAFDVLDDLAPAVHAEVDVYIGHGDALGIEEAFEEQLVLERVDVGYLHHVGDERARRRSTAWPDGDSLLLGVADEVPHDQEVAGEVHLLDDAQL